MPFEFYSSKRQEKEQITIQKYCTGLGNIFAYPRFRRIEGSVGIDGRINRSRKMIAPLKSQRAYSNPKKLELGIKRVWDDAIEVLPTEKDMRKFWKVGNGKKS